MGGGEETVGGGEEAVGGREEVVGGGEETGVQRHRQALPDSLLQENPQGKTRKPAFTI